MPISTDRAKLALVLGGALWLAGWALLLAFPQFPDGDLTARAQFAAWYGEGWRYNVRQAWWWNLAGAAMAWGAIAKLPPRRRASLLYGALLLLLLPWGYAQSVGWQGDLFLAPGVPARLADSQSVLIFERFLIPPSPDGAGRDLAMRVTVNGAPSEMSAASPLYAAGWTLRPLWYGAVLTHPLLDKPLYVGASGTLPVRLNDGRALTLDVNVEALTVRSEPPLAGWTAAHYAIIRAAYPFEYPAAPPGD